MDVNTTSTATAAQTAAATTSGTKKAALSSDFETFLKMLTTQMQNQDPLNPMESTEFATQLATFSSVEQQTKANELLSSMATQLSVLGMSQLAGWVGMEARTDGPVWVDGAEVAFNPEPAPAADRMAIVAYDENGTQVARHEVAASDEPMSWMPADADGVPLPAGAYTFALESLNGGTVLDSTYLSTYAPIVEAMTANGSTLLVLEGGIAVDPSAITAIRQPAS